MKGSLRVRITMILGCSRSSQRWLMTRNQKLKIMAGGPGDFPGLTSLAKGSWPATNRTRTSTRTQEEKVRYRIVRNRDGEVITAVQMEKASPDEVLHS